MMKLLFRTGAKHCYTQVVAMLCSPHSVDKDSTDAPGPCTETESLIGDLEANPIACKPSHDPATAPYWPLAQMMSLLPLTQYAQPRSVSARQSEPTDFWIPNQQFGSA
jgi:hypothetical protein